MGDPVSKTEYSDDWLTWEDELVKLLLTDVPETIKYTSYDLVTSNIDDE